MELFWSYKLHPTFCIDMNKCIKAFIVKLFNEFGKLFGILVRKNKYRNLILDHISDHSTIRMQAVHLFFPVGTDIGLFLREHHRQ